MNIEFILTLLKTPGFGRKTVNLILSDLQFNPQTIIEIQDIITEAKEKYKRLKVPSLDELEKAQQSAIKIIEDSHKEGIEIIPLGGSRYPAKLAKISDPPIIIYVKGDVQCLNHDKIIAIIGTREPTKFGIKSAVALSEYFTKKGFIVASGLAKGCDSAAHSGCLNAKGQTIAVLGHGLHMIYPAENKDLAQSIIDNSGCLLSEYPLGTNPRPNYFVERDRLQSGISDALVVIETGIKGGSMHAINACLEEHKFLACLKHPEKFAKQPTIQGNINLLATDKVTPISKSEDVDRFIEQINRDKTQKNIVTDNSLKKGQLSLFDNPLKYTDLIRYVVWYATQQGFKLTTMRLVKFIYLADLYQARIKRGQTLTKFPWKFIYYGPYCSEAIECIEKAVEKNFICKDPRESQFDLDKEYNLFWCYEDTAEKFEEHIHVGALGKLQNAIKKFGDDTPELLDYVYFETEPMRNAKKGDLLDFSKAEMPDVGKTIKLKKLSPKAIKKAREQINKIGGELKDDQRRFIKGENEAEKYKDEAYYKFIKLLDGNELEIGLKGTAKIKIQE